MIKHSSDKREFQSADNLAEASHERVKHTTVMNEFNAHAVKQNIQVDQ